MACRPAHDGQLSIVPVTAAGARTTSVIQYRTASSRRPAATRAVIRSAGPEASGRVPGITHGAS